MYLERDTFVRRNSLNRNDITASYCGLLRVEHFDKGVPFDEQDWSKSKDVPAITGAVMAFNKSGFEKLGGFSTRYIYGHYEDADLSIRWQKSVGAVSVHPHLRLVHLEGQGSTARGEEFRGASLSNRHFFTAQHGAYFDAHRDELGKANGLSSLR
jgi:GT2 family glycosyltransferase